MLKSVTIRGKTYQVLDDLGIQRDTGIHLVILETEQGSRAAGGLGDVWVFYNQESGRKIRALAAAQ